MIELQIYKFLTEVLCLTDETLVQQVMKVSEVYQVDKGEFIYFQEEPITQVAFLIEGVTRGFVIDLEGNDITECLSHLCGACIMPDPSLDTTAAANIEALTDCEIFSVPVREIKALMGQNMSIVQFYNQMLLVSSAYHRELKTVTYQYSAMQRYQWFLKAYPGLINLVPNKYVASLLNMTPVTLSRLRRVLRGNEDMCAKQL